MTRMTIEIPDDEYKKLKITAIQIGVSIKDYVLEALRLKAKILVRDDGVVRILNNDTIAALEESRKGDGKRKKYNTVSAMIKDLESKK
jgi:hypothetical protein